MSFERIAAFEVSRCTLLVRLLFEVDLTSAAFLGLQLVSESCAPSEEELEVAFFAVESTSRPGFFACSLCLKPATPLLLPHHGNPAHPSSRGP